MAMRSTHNFKCAYVNCSNVQFDVDLYFHRIHVPSTSNFQWPLTTLIMKIIAFLQNLWVKNPERVKEMFARHPDGREYMLRMLLFHGGRTGKILMDTLGEELVNKIVWEESTTEISGNANAVFPADLGHIRRVINKHKPEAVVTFGRIASKAVFIVANGMMAEPADFQFELLCVPHPCARPAADPIGALAELKQKLSRYMA